MPDNIPQIWVGDDGMSPIVEFDGGVPRIVDCEECPCGFTCSFETMPTVASTQTNSSNLIGNCTDPCVDILGGAPAPSDCEAAWVNVTTLESNNIDLTGGPDGVPVRSFLWREDNEFAIRTFTIEFHCVLEGQRVVAYDEDAVVNYWTAPEDGVLITAFASNIGQFGVFGRWYRFFPKASDFDPFADPVSLPIGYWGVNADAPYCATGDLVVTFT